MKDAVVLNNLHARNFDFNNVEEMLRYEAVERKPRVLDKAPKRLTFKKAKDIPVFGCKQEFIIAYNSALSETSGELFRLDLNNVQKICDKEVYVVLQTLMRQGICYCKQLSEECYELFRIICTIPVDTLTIERVYQALSSVRPGSYWADQILSAIKACLFGDSPVLLYWTSVAQFTGLYKACFESGKDVIVSECKTEKDVDAFIRQHYKEAKADKEFMKTTYTDGISKALVAMLYYLHETNPEVLELEGKEAGW
ncbi:MAG: hypothetical protein NC548_11305 [Lachnospiraceae bacterium]|nr:hypothetical protein [Lachnospiraceae bacterium]